MFLLLSAVKIYSMSFPVLFDNIKKDNNFVFITIVVKSTICYS